MRDGGGFHMAGSNAVFSGPNAVSSSSLTAASGGPLTFGSRFKRTGTADAQRQALAHHMLVHQQQQAAGAAAALAVGAAAAAAAAGDKPRQQIASLSDKTGVGGWDVAPAAGGRGGRLQQHREENSSTPGTADSLAASEGHHGGQPHHGPLSLSPQAAHKSGPLALVANSHGGPELRGAASGAAGLDMHMLPLPPLQMQMQRALSQRPSMGGSAAELVLGAVNAAYAWVPAVDLASLSKAGEVGGGHAAGAWAASNAGSQVNSMGSLMVDSAERILARADEWALGERTDGLLLRRLVAGVPRRR